MSLSAMLVSVQGSERVGSLERRRGQAKNGDGDDDDEVSREEDGNESDLVGTTRETRETSERGREMRGRKFGEHGAGTDGAKAKAVAGSDMQVKLNQAACRHRTEADSPRDGMGRRKIDSRLAWASDAPKLLRFGMLEGVRVLVKSGRPQGVKDRKEGEGVGRQPTDRTPQSRNGNISLSGQIT